MIESDDTSLPSTKMEDDRDDVSSCSSTLAEAQSTSRRDVVKFGGDNNIVMLPHPHETLRSETQLIPSPPIEPLLSTPRFGNKSSSMQPNASPKSRHSRQRQRSQRVFNTDGLTNVNDDNSYTTINQRLVEYFCVVTSVPQPSAQPATAVSERKSNLPATPVSHEGSCNLHCYPTVADLVDDGNIHLPQQQGRSCNDDNRQSFVPTITARYPETDYSDNPFNPMILHFCFPFLANGSGDTRSEGSGVVVYGTTEYELPRVHHFVLTLGCGHKMYGTCLTVLEEYDESLKEVHPNATAPIPNTDGDGIQQRTESAQKKPSNHTKSQKTLYVPKVLCLLSTWPYLTAFREYLSQLYRLAVMTNCMTAPIERYIVNVCCEIPAPPPGAYEIQVTILDSTIRFWAPPAKLPIAYTALPYQILFECLDIYHVILVWTALMVERKVLLISKQNSVLTVCAEILCSLLFPMRWSHLYVPMLPRMLCPMLDW
jgi:DENN (AEX-3) domain/uDENN domain